MFQFLFKYPSPVFTKGRFVLLSAWPAWLLPVLIVAAASSLALLIRWRLRETAPGQTTYAQPAQGRRLQSQSAIGLTNLRALTIWAMQSALVALVLTLLWQPAMTIGELSSQQNIIAVVVDDSRSMSIADSNGKTREAAALAALQGGVLCWVAAALSNAHLHAGQQAFDASTASNQSPPLNPRPTSTQASSSLTTKPLTFPSARSCC